MCSLHLQLLRERRPEWWRLLAMPILRAYGPDERFVVFALLADYQPDYQDYQFRTPLARYTISADEEGWAGQAQGRRREGALPAQNIGRAGSAQGLGHTKATMTGESSPHRLSFSILNADYPPPSHLITTSQLPSMADRLGLNDFTFTFSLSSSTTSFRGTDGRTGTRQESPSVPGHEMPGSAVNSSSGVPDGDIRPSKRRRRDEESQERVKRPVGRPRKRPLYEGHAVEIGSFTVAGNSRSQSKSASSSTARRAFPLAPIFTRTAASPLSTHTSTSTNSQQTSRSAPASTQPPDKDPYIPQDRTGERVIPEDGFLDIFDRENEADGSGEGGGDESDGEGDEEDPGELDGDMGEVNEPEEVLGDSSQENQGAKGKDYRAPLPDWLQSAFDSRVQECRERDSRGWPQLYYRHKSFWFPTTSSWFLLQGAVASPQRLFNPRFFLWDPLALTKAFDTAARDAPNRS
ncbi:hypothetical protein BKA70DRAFT_1240031 [Coprinopsis sp. MPI-PUGE-AT-0042]|nr:hypothetical protein BKA70DRAFT_1240031 [Coprinopsis sp. MPI-PUGE-AT-0042]